MNTTSTLRRDGASDRPASTKERVALAAGWTVANAVPDRLYAMGGKWIAYYWEECALLPGRFDTLEWFAKDVGTLAEAKAIPIEAGREVVATFVGELARRGCALPHDAVAIAESWLEAGRAADPQGLVDAWRQWADHNHKPTLARPACRHCGAAQ